MADIKGVTILGSTGTIGMNTLDVLARHPQRYRVVALTANASVDKLYQQCIEYKPRYAVLVDADAAAELRQRLSAAGADIEVLSGESGLCEAASLPQVDYVMAAIVGAAGLMPTLAAARSGKRVLLANKEALVMAGQVFMDEIRNHHAELLPIDSEHNAIFQCMPQQFSQGLELSGVNRILLTASGGPFRERPIELLENVTPEEAVAHPNWVMGKKISVDSATMMNKGLEVIEACWLFNTTADKIQVVIHPSSVIHSMVSYNDGSVLAQMGNPDMRTPIAHALGWPQRIESGVEPLDVFAVAKLEFQKPDMARFPCLALAYEALRLGGTASAILNAANEVAVAAFLDGLIRFTDIAATIQATMQRLEIQAVTSLETILQADRDARTVACNIIEQSGKC